MKQPLVGSRLRTDPLIDSKGYHYPVEGRVVGVEEDPTQIMTNNGVFQGMRIKLRLNDGRLYRTAVYPNDARKIS